MLKIVWVDGKKLLRESFKNVKKDFLELKSQMNVIEEELVRLQEKVKNIREQPEEPREEENISESQPSLSVEDLRLELRKIIQEEVREALREQNTQAADVVSAESQPETEPIKEKISPPTPPKKITDNLKEDLIKSYERNRKDIVKQQILGEANKGDLTKIALRDIVVDQKNYCSKASFYRYMDELELQSLITYQRRKGKDIIEIKQLVSEVNLR